VELGEIFKRLAAFFDGYFLAILVATGILFLILLVTWWIYKTLSKRNVFHLYQKIPGTLAIRKGSLVLYILKYFLVFPLYTFIGFLVFAFSLFILSNPQTLDAQTKILFVAIVMVSTIRVAAYVHESMAEDFAKLIPLTMFSILLAHPSIENFGITVEKFNTFFMLIPGFLKYLVFTVVLEGVLRGSTWLFGNIDADEGENEEA
jgi:hypothetical protein